MKPAPFFNNKYTKTYFSLINRSKSRVIEGYTENHHVVPKSLGGSDDPDNLVKLTPKEHYLCHALLPKMVEGNARYKMMAAFNMMHVGHDGKRYTSNLYEYYKVKFYEEHGNRQRGVPRWSKHQRIEMSKNRSGRPWSEKARSVKRKKPTAKAVAVYRYENGAFVGEWESVSLCAKELNCDPTQVWKMCEGKPQRPAQNGKVYPIRQHKGYVFSYA